MDSTEGWVNLLSDVWQNISKEHLLGYQLSLFGMLLTYALRHAGDEHREIAIVKQLEQVIEQAQQAKWRVGAIITDNAGQCSRARRILALRWPQMVFLFCFAHDVDNLVKAVLRSTLKDVAAQAATAVKILNASSSKWHGCFAPLLRVQSALQMLHRRYKSYDDFPEQLQLFGDSSFWEELKDAEAATTPLAYASYRLHRDENSLGDVPLFMLGFALHPLYAETARTMPDTAVSEIGALGKIAVHYYRRLLKTEDIPVET
ncbi:hypothetical protein GN958_ATG18750 [Phytophthora infestans]|uniref:DUF659 domain-containing protein n=1 Tax=Phytophthora infestans TaxID=4787 RepID=A0A8S9TUB2_PHYIN|nr:hypothetical protein GN958_ATG18750 [Phytophthora infestans]